MMRALLALALLSIASGAMSATTQDTSPLEHYQNLLFGSLAISATLIIIISAVAVRFIRLSKALRESEERWKFALEGAGDGVWDWNVPADKVIFSKRYKDMYGFSDDDVATNEDAWEQRIHADDRARVEDDIHACLEGRTETYSNEHRVRCKDGNIKWVLSRGMVVSRDADGNALRMIGTHTDITDRKAAADYMQYQAQHDVLTGLPNRALMTYRLQQALAQAKRDKTRSAVMFIDLDKFKPVNDTLGHAIGDLLLKEVAQRMQSSVRAADTVARIGGDEFIVVLPIIEQEQDAMIVAEKILHALHQPFKVAGHTLNISASVGVAVYPEHGDNDQLLIRNADTAMYYAKQDGRNNFKFFLAGMQEVAK
jgi:diguanylate cyclase (GGDEF)-like protein/PAS domain S-box-containing protein